MLNIFVRILLFVFGAISIIDGGLPSMLEESHVDSHGIYGGRGFNNAEYRIVFNGSKVGYCTISRAGYEILKDGDAVTVRSSRLLHHCIEVKRDDQVMFKSRWWKFGCLIAGAICIAIAVFGNLDRNDSDGDAGDRGDTWEFDVS